VPPATIDESSRRELRKELEWDGFGVLGPGLFARPARPEDEVELSETTRALGIDRHVAVVTARAVPRGTGSIATLTGDCWDLRGVAAAYRGFVARFRGVAHALGHGADPTPQQCFVLRTLLIHEFRRVTLHDPQLPAELLPSNWPESAAYALCRELYRLTHERAERHLSVMMETSRGALRSAAPHFYRRFGGL
jgi:phenylacetic acid degradation operon negative regulatory protein